MTFAALISAAAYLSMASGCIVGQRPGKGRCLHLNEETTGAPYWLYLPEGYGESNTAAGEPVKYPLVMTFHGMKPFDDDHRQIREWQQEADRYGFVVCAPHLLVADLLGPLPLRNPDHPSLKRDERNIIAIMDELYRTVDVDANKVLATSWSYGGYVAHYMANRYPERFSCIAVRQSNFNADLMDPSTVPRYRDHKVGIFYTENDFAICRSESHAAAEWYAKRGFDLTFAVFEKKGHERTPGVAAELFARSIGAEPKTPPTELASMQVISLPAPVTSNVATSPAPTNARANSRRDPNRRDVQPVEVARAGPESRWDPLPPNPTPKVVPRRREPTVIVPSVPAKSHAVGRNAPLRTTPAVKPRSKRDRNRRANPIVRPSNRGPVDIRVSSSIGVAPLLVSYSATIPKNLAVGTSMLWMYDGEPISNGRNGQKVFRESGEHKLEVLIAGKDGKTYRASRTITVIAPASSRRR